MIIYNVTISVAHSIAKPWLQWMQQEHAPALLATGCFIEFRVLKLLDVDETEGLTYAIQYKAPSRAHYNNYIAQHAAHFRNQSFEKWGNNFIAFRTVMEVVHEM